jgi:hypothetical protein
MTNSDYRIKKKALEPLDLATYLVWLPRPRSRRRISENALVLYCTVYSIIFNFVLGPLSLCPSVPRKPFH